MSIYAPDPFAKKLRGALLAVLFIFVLTLGFVGAGLAIGSEYRLVLERSGPGTFRVIRSDYFAGYEYFTKTIGGVTEVVTVSAARDWNSDSIVEKQRRQSRKSLDFYGADRRRIGWNREDDQRQIEDFMQGTEPRLALANPPPFWRRSVAWFSIGFGLLIFIGAIRSNFFPRTKTLSGLP